MGADEALRLGLVDRVFPTADLLAQVRAYAVDLAQSVSPRSMAVMKRQIWEAPFQTPGEAIALAETEMRASFQSADFREGVAHFLEKRPANFTGK
jgi:enoyl-CoA hydratase/carnithine racemase